MNNLFTFDVFSIKPNETINILKKVMDENEINGVSVIEKKKLGELIPEHYIFKIKNKTYAIIYKPSACYSYNVIKIGKLNVKVATLFTMMSMYLTFLFINRPYYDEDRILCISKFLFDIYELI